MRVSMRLSAKSARTGEELWEARHNFTVLMRLSAKSARTDKFDALLNALTHSLNAPQRQISPDERLFEAFFRLQKASQCASAPNQPGHKLRGEKGFAN